MRHLNTIVFGSLLTASLMWPSEGAIRGDGLYLVVAWLVGGAICAWNATPAVRSTSEQKRGFERFAAPAVVLLVFAFWLSTWHVFKTLGDRRAALNLAFEWTAIGVAWWITRRLCQESNGRRSVLILITALGFGSAALGICQHHISFPRKAEWYLQQRSKLDSTTEGAAAQSALEVAVVQQELQRHGIPPSGRKRELFEQRLLASSEPIGAFALANSLGGLLVVALLILASGVLTAFGDSKRSVLSRAGLTLALIVIAYCLLLTKSRTAWVAGFVGLTLLLLQRRSHATMTKLRPILLIGLCGLVGVVTTGVLTGAIDKEVVLESPRSLQFRLLYWLGAAGVIQDDPIFGAGPGNFRNAYLTHKAAEASEEILDPHNIVLDAWASVGLAGLAGVGLLMLSGLLASSGPAENDPRGTAPPPSRRLAIRGSGLIPAIFGGFGLHVVWYWIQGGNFADLAVVGLADGGWLEWDSGLWVVPVAGLAILPVIAKFWEPTRSIATAAFAALLVHLLGAGGLQISGVMLLLLVLHAAATARPAAEGSFDVGSPDLAASEERGPRVLRGVASLLFIAAAVGTVRFGLIPVVSSQQYLAMAQSSQLNGRASDAVKQIDRAIEIDPFAVESRQRKAEWLTYKVMRANVARAARSSDFNANSAEAAAGEGLAGKNRADIESWDLPADNDGSSRQLLESAIDAATALIEADRRGWVGYHLRSQAVYYGWRTVNDRSLLQSAVNDAEAALALYPTHGRLLADMAETYLEAEMTEEAVDAAKRALRQEQVNQDWGHVDRYLDPEIRQRLMEISHDQR
ncbi:O-antigen ligase family protein [Fuerstiella marisgermanici]|uniref:Putative bicarbonate transporter, IctB family n=1 Tax=Fuerstiella marisgermanici TaxID=1891926 RepID=A0A1P8WRY0_9PLAN|nr:O-antigen ligase family protein [Fuerstiella marisgermanici]APZ96816.1 putative bicarbonate transporter, IctB family [Fuerstiella marisgermanici]